MKFRLPTCPTPRRKLTNGTRRFLEAFFTSLLWAPVIKYSKPRNQATHVAQVHWADVTIFQPFENYPVSRGFFQSDMAFSICEAFHDSKKPPLAGQFENINIATDSYFIDQYFAKAISTYVPFYSLNLRRLARVELSFELEFFRKRNEKKT